MKPLLADQKDRYLSFFDARRARDAAWIEPLRRRAADRFAEVGFPTTRVEAWKYTDVSPLLKHEFEPSTSAGCERVDFKALEALQVPEASGATLVFIDGHLCKDLSRVSSLPDGVILADLFEAAESPSGVLVRERLSTLVPYETEPFAALNTAITEGGAFLYVPDGCVVEAPIHLIYLAGGAPMPAVSHPRTLLIAGANSSVRVVETFAPAGAKASFANAVAEIALAEGARVEHYRVQRELESAGYHVGSTDVHVGRSASYTSISMNIGGAFSRHDLRVALAAEGAECRIDGLYVLEGEQHSDSHTRIDHLVPNTSSSQIYKGVVDDAARAVFNGKVVVHEGAQKTEAHQTNKNLMLSATARVDTKPELEIFADDVICTHGATVGALEDEERFYLASRGLDEETARALLTYGFAEEIVEEVKIESVRHHLDAFILNRFQKGMKLR